MSAGTDDEALPVKAGTYADLARRMDRMEGRQDDQGREIAALASTVARVEQNQNHAVELNRLRFDSLDTGLKSIGAQVGDFMRRIEGILSGEIETAQGRQGAKIVSEYEAWKATVETRLDGHDKFETQGKLLARIGVLLVTSNVVSILVAVYAIATGNQ